MRRPRCRRKSAAVVAAAVVDAARAAVRKARRRPRGKSPRSGIRTSSRASRPRAETAADEVAAAEPVAAVEAVEPVASPPVAPPPVAPAPQVSAPRPATVRADRRCGVGHRHPAHAGHDHGARDGCAASRAALPAADRSVATRARTGRADSRSDPAGEACGSRGQAGCRAAPRSSRARTPDPAADAGRSAGTGRNPADVDVTARHLTPHRRRRADA